MSIHMIRSQYLMHIAFTFMPEWRNKHMLPQSRLKFCWSQAKGCSSRVFIGSTDCDQGLRAWGSCIGHSTTNWCKRRWCLWILHRTDHGCFHVIHQVVSLDVLLGHRGLCDPTSYRLAGVSVFLPHMDSIVDDLRRHD